MMRVVHTVVPGMALVRSWEAFEGRFPSVTSLLEALSTRVETHWVSWSEAPARFTSPDGRVAVHIGRRKGRARAAARLAMLEPDVVHVRGLNDLRSMALIAGLARTVGFRLVVQDHGSPAPRTNVKRTGWRAALADAQVLFGSPAAKDAWLAAGVLRAPQTHVVWPASSSFSPIDEDARSTLRAELGIEGRPIFGWLAHLDDNKDPLTILSGLAPHFERAPEARLYLRFVKDGLRPACAARAAETPSLEGRVHFLGPAPHEEIELFLQCLDYFVQGSHREAYGYALAEALSVGAYPIVSDIPSFAHALGPVGARFRPGDAQHLTEVLAPFTEPPTLAERAALTQHFDRSLSLPAIADRLVETYSRAR